MSLPFEELADGVFRRRYPSLDLNVGVVLGGDGVVVIDTRASHSEGDELARELQGLTRLPVRWVINTHWHWDHVFGNAAFAGAEVWGHVVNPSRMIDGHEEAKADAVAWLGEQVRADVDAVEVVVPSVLVSTQAALDTGGRTVAMAWLGRGHTDGDLVVAVKGTDVVFAGDLIEDGGPPNYGDSYPFAWPSTVAAMTDRFGGRFVPGHGEVMDVVAVTAQGDELAAVAEACRRAVGAGLATAPNGPYPEDTMQAAFRRALLEHSQAAPDAIA
jgi:glyoxylase-like metal-dependent hydrolase (beta-lactamase superfamily II)